MLWVLLKRQLLEVFRSYFYNPKKNTRRSPLAVAAWFVFFALIMVGMMGGMFTFLSITLCDSLVEAGLGWLYFALMGGIAILLGAFGSVFNTFSSLYLSKDNDLLLSLPIPVRDIIGARLMNVWLMGAMYVAVVILPALVVYWVQAGLTAGRLLCGLLFFAILTAIVLILSTLLGWVVAKISLKLKNKSFVTVLVSLVFIGAYYFFYFKANDMIRDLLQNAAVYGAKIKGAAYGVYLFGRIGEADPGATALFAALAIALLAGVWIVLSRTFLGIATDTGRTERIRYREKAVRPRSPFGALLAKEFSRFGSSANYMLNCGLGTLFLAAFGPLLLIKGREVLEALDQFLAARPGSGAVLVATALCMVAALNDIAAPSVSLEGKSLWIPQSLPVKPRSVLRAKALVQLIVTGIPMLISALCAAFVLRATPAAALTACLVPLLYAVFSALFDTFLGVKLPILNWTSETAPIKQGSAPVIALFGGWAVCVALGGLYMLIGYKLGPALYLALWAALFAAASLLLLRWLDRGGARAFEEL